MFHNTELCFFRGFAFPEHAPLVNLNEGSKNANLTDARLFRTHPILDKAHLRELGGDGEREQVMILCVGYLVHVHSGSLLNSAVPELCAVCVQEIVTRILLIIIQPTEGSWKN